ncbi:MAG: hypothetical protein ACYDAC_06890 [Candidatus Dormibacteria bacterium]
MSKRAFLGFLALPVLCCGLPALLAAGTLAGVGGWLTADGSRVAAVGVLLAATVIGGRWWLQRRRCGIPAPRADGLPRP